MKSKNISKFILYCVSIILTIIYIFYRIFFTIPTKLGIVSIVFALIVLLVEIWESIDFFIYFLNILSVNKKSPKIPVIKANINFPDIDILIATYNEDQNILKRTIRACLELDYPEKDKLHIYLCDDGNRREIETLAKNMKINYISRSNNKDSKAGNYNHALKKISSPYIATFDADMAPTHDFLMKTLPFFIKNENEKIGFVQLPQSFINPDIFQYRFKLENQLPFEQDYFYHYIQIAKNETNSAIYCGTNTLFSRQALLDVNGFATGTLTEDIATGMLIESKGYKCIALPDIGAYGISVNDFYGFAKQRSRWASGCIQTLKKYKILTCKGLSFRQKLEYLSCVSYWFFGIRRFIYLIAPLLFSIFGIIIVDCDILTFITIWLPTYLIKRFALDITQGHKRSSTWNKIYEIILTPILGFRTLKELIGFKQTKFEVSPKNVSTPSMSKENKKVLGIHLSLLILNIIGFVMCIARVYDTQISNYILSFVWTFSNIFYLTLAVIFDCRYKKYDYKNFVPNKITKYSNKTIFSIFFHRRASN